MNKITPPITILIVNATATMMGLFVPSITIRLPDIYLASIGGSWAMYQLNAKEGDEGDGNY